MSGDQDYPGLLERSTGAIERYQAANARQRDAIDRLLVENRRLKERVAELEKSAKARTR